MSGSRFPTGDLPAHDVELIQLLADGLSATEIARVQGVSVVAIEQRLTAAYAQIGAQNDVHAVAMAMRAGWLKGSPKPN